MSFIEIQCGDVLASVVFIIEGELQEIPQAAAIQSHLVTCAPCSAELEHERLMQQMLQDVLKRTCDEQAPAHDASAERWLRPLSNISENPTDDCYGPEGKCGMS